MSLDQPLVRSISPSIPSSVQTLISYVLRTNIADLNSDGEFTLAILTHAHRPTFLKGFVMLSSI